MRSSCICMLRSNDGAKKPRRVSGPWIVVLLICNNWNKWLLNLNLWRNCVSVTVLVDGLHWSHMCLRRICQSSVCVCVLCCSLGSSTVKMVPCAPNLLWSMSQPHNCCGSHIDTLKRLASSASLKLVCNIPIVLSLSTMVRRCTALVSYHLWNGVFL